MIRKITFSGLIVDVARDPLADRPIALQVFMLKGGWRSIGESTSGDDGRFKGEANAEGFEDVTVAPRFQLTIGESGAVSGAIPEMKLSRGVLALGFGAVVESESAVGARKSVVVTEEAEESGPILQATEQMIATLQVELVAARAEVASMASALAKKQQSLDTAIQERDELQAKVGQLQDATASAARIADLAGEVASSLNAATSPAGTGGFHVGDATVTLKGYLVGGGERFKPLDIVSGASGAAAGASELSFSVQRRPSEPIQINTMPDLVGLTAISAQRAIRPLGLVAQIVETSGKPAGAVLKQYPAAGSELAIGVSVILQVGVETSEA